MKLARKVILYVFVLFLSIAFFLSVPDRLDPLGEASSSCVRDELPPVYGEENFMVSSHALFCSNFVHDSAVYMFVHVRSEPDSRANMFLRYSQDSAGPFPSVAWRDAHTLYVDASKITGITKWSHQVGDVNVIFRPELLPRQIDGPSYSYVFAVLGVAIGSVCLALFSLTELLKIVLRQPLL